MDQPHLHDLRLAEACAAGDEAAWERFVRDYRPVLHRAADAMDRTGRAREAADALLGELYARDLFRYFHGRSSLATWLRSVLAQRFVDRLRQDRRLDPLPDEPERAGGATPPANGPDRQRFIDLLKTALAASFESLAPRDLLRLRFYYAQRLTLAEIGRLTREHEATVSRQLARTRRDLRAQVENWLRTRGGLDETGVKECVAVGAELPAELDLGAALENDRKIAAVDRSHYKERT
jgi:RNA polymerase sigma factor (sigma-70 family)